MIIIEMAEIELIGGHIGFTVNIEICKIELTDGHIGFMIIIEMAKIELIGGHIGIMLIIYRDGQNRINRRPYWNNANYNLYRLPK